MARISVATDGTSFIPGRAGRKALEIWNTDAANPIFYNYGEAVSETGAGDAGIELKAGERRLLVDPVAGQRLQLRAKTAPVNLNWIEAK